MDKRYQIFISSTFTDLKDERQAVLRATLELDHMPAGMELFPAADESAWQLIRDVIDASDYYVLIIGGRYGSLDEEGIGFTEKEYDYACSAHKPVIPLLHENPDSLPRERTETDDKSWERLKHFRAKVEKRHTCVYWRGADDLKAKVIIGLTAAVKRHPAVGWIRADKVPSDATLADMLAMRNRISELEVQLGQETARPPAGTENLLQGEDVIEIHVSFVARERTTIYPNYVDQNFSGSIELTWNEIFAAVAPSMINEASDAALRSAFKAYFESAARKAWKNQKTLAGKSLHQFSFRDEEIETCIVQLRALGLIGESQRRRSVRDVGTYWSLTRYGDHAMVQLRALHKNPPAAARPSAATVEEVTKRKKKNDSTKS